MAQYQAFDSNVEVNGQAVLTIVDGLGAFRLTAFEILRNHKIVDPQTEQFYPQQFLLDALQEISNKFGPITLLQIGKKIPENAVFPPRIDTVQKALQAIDEAYHLNHRGGEIGHYEVKCMQERCATIVCNNPYPCDFDRGIIWAMIDRLGPADSLPRIEHDDSQPCRKQGADSCTYLVSW